MSEPIVSIEKIEREAQAAALIYSDVNAACPYPFGTAAATEFKRAFLALGTPDPQDRRPGLRKLAEKIQRDNPGWSHQKCAATAKAQWTELTQ